jgi:hypothetical protein
VEGAACEHLFVTSQGSAYMRFRRALDRGNVTEALSAASELWEGVGGWGAPTPRRLPARTAALRGRRHLEAVLATNLGDQSPSPSANCDAPLRRLALSRVRGAH